MPLGPGKYDRLCTLVRERAHANGACVIVLEGADGNGFSVQAPLDLHLYLSAKLREVADEIDRSFGLSPERAS
jgi:hypothetical protein